MKFLNVSPLQTVLSPAFLLLTVACSPSQQTSFATSTTPSTTSSASTASTTTALNSASIAACNAQMQQAVANLNLAENAFYSDLNLAIPIASKQSQFIPGTNGATAVIIHGFDSSPADMSDLMASVNSAGYSVLAPLLTGFGADAAAANAATITDWRKSVTDAVAIAQGCSSQVSLIGHSLGGALVADQLINQGLQGISSVVLLEPALKTRFPTLNIALSLLLTQTNTLSVSSFQAATGIDPYTYLPILQPAAGAAEPSIPLLAAQNVVNLENVFSTSSATSSVATLLVVSQDDYVIDPTFDVSFSSSHFTKLQTLNFPASEYVNHFVESPSSNPQYQSMITQVLALLAAN